MKQALSHHAKTLKMNYVHARGKVRLLARLGSTMFGCRSKKHVVVLAAALLLAGTACDTLTEPAVPTFSPQSSSVVGTGPAVSTHLVRKGTITGQVALRGRVVAAQEVPIFFKTDGWIKEITVNLGDHVDKGTVIAEMESPSLEDGVSEAQYRLEVARMTLEYGSRPSTVDRIALAKAGVEGAAIALERARLNLAKLMAPPLPEEIEAARLAIERSKNSLWATQEERDGIKGNSPGYQGTVADARVSISEAAVRAAELDLEIKLRGPKPEDIALAQNAVVTAEASLASARASLDYEQTVADLAAATLEKNVAMLAKEVTRREELLAIATRRLVDTRLEAPFSGTIVSLDAKVGDNVKPYSPIGILADPTVLQVEANVPIEQADTVATGMPATIILDGTQDKTLTGKITSIADKPTTWQGKSVYRVNIAFDGGANASVPMRVGADITVSGKTQKDILLVPKEVITQDADRRYVQLMVSGKEKRTEIRTGATSGDWVEIISGLTEGDQVVMPRTTTAQAQPK